MEIINGKVWIENTGKEITNVSQLDFNIYKNIRKLINAGAIIVIGPGNPPEYGNGIYCTNLNIDEIISIINKEIQAHEEEKDAVTSIFETIKKIGRSYYLESIHAGMGFNTGDILYSLEEKYNNDIIPKINNLSNDDKEELSSLISPLLEDDSISKKFIEELIGILNNKQNIR